jgi:hypothetical protein
MLMMSTPEGVQPPRCRGGNGTDYFRPAGGLRKAKMDSVGYLIDMVMNMASS